MINCIKRSRTIKQDKRSKFSIIHVEHIHYGFYEEPSQLSEIVYMQIEDHLTSAGKKYCHGDDLL